MREHSTREVHVEDGLGVARDERGVLLEPRGVPEDPQEGREIAHLFHGREVLVEVDHLQIVGWVGLARGGPAWGGRGGGEG